MVDNKQLANEGSSNASLTNARQQPSVSDEDDVGGALFGDVGLPVLHIEKDPDVEDSEDFLILARIQRR